MNRILKNRYLLFVLIVSFIILLPGVAVFAQRPAAINGIVVDENNMPLPGATILIKGTTTGVSADLNGKFTLQAKPTDVLQITYIGYKTQELAVNSRTDFRIKLESDSNVLEDVQVIAYGQQKKMTVTGAISSIGGSDLVKSPSASIANVMAGSLSGVSSVQYSGQPGVDDAEIFVRGTGSLDADRSRPLILVDGVERPFTRMDPNEIESVTVLKDASATAVFGVRGANGVILVTTKRGKEGKTSISVSSSVGVTQAMRLPKMADSYTHAVYHNEMNRNDGVAPIFSDFAVEMFRTNSDPIIFPNTDWSEELFKKASMQTQHNLSISGGTERVRYFTSLGYLYQDGLLKQHDESYNPNWRTNRYNYRVNLDIDVTKTTLMSINIGGISESRFEPAIGSQNNMWMEILRAQPYSSPGILDGKIVIPSKLYYNNDEDMLRPGYQAYYGKGYAKVSDNLLNIDLAVTQKLDCVTKGLSIQVKGAYNSKYVARKSWTASPERIRAVYRNSLTDPTLSYDDPAFLDREIVYQLQSTGEDLAYGGENYNTKTRDWYLEASIRYERTFGKHAVTGLLLHNLSKKYYMANNTAIPRGYLGLVGRATYAYANKYLVDFNIGYNGSENFHPDRRFGVFPAASAGWVISEENFLKESKVIDFLKLRASYGMVGNDILLDGAGNDLRFLYTSDKYVSGGGYYFGADIRESSPAIYEGMLGNKLVTWETARKQNYGIDITLLGNRLTFSADLFFEHRDDILIKQQSLPAYIAADLPAVNIGKTSNKGYELSLGWNDLTRNGNFRYWSKFNVSFNRNKVVFKDEVKYDEPWKGETGRSIGIFEGYIFDRFYENGDFDEAGNLLPGLPRPAGTVKPGDLKFKNLNDDDVIDGKDVAMFGYSERPEYTFGWITGFQWKNFDFSMTWTGATNVNRRMEEDYTRPFNTGKAPLMQFMVDGRWTEERGQSATFPRLTQANKEYNSQSSTFWVKDASYMRLKNLEIGYSIHAKALKKAGIESLRIYANGYNLLTFDYLGFIDPESKVGGNNRYPNLRIFNLGVNINF